MPRRSRPESLEELLAELPEDLRRQAFTHSSWVEHRAESYERLAFLGDVVLSLAVSDHLYPRFERYGAGPAHQGARPGRERPVVRARGARAAACPTSCARRRPRAPAAPPTCWSTRSACSPRSARRSSARPTSSFGFERTAPAVVESFARRDRGGAREPGGLQVGAPGAAGPARRGGGVPDRRRGGPGARPQLHRAWPRWTGEELGRGEGKTKKAAEQEAALHALDALGRGGGLVMHLRSISHEGLQVLPRPDQARVRPGRVRGRRPERVGQVEHHRRRAVGARRAVAAGGARAVDEGRDLRRRRTACRARTRPRWRS